MKTLKDLIPLSLAIIYGVSLVYFLYNPSHTDGPYRESDSSASTWYVGS